MATAEDSETVCPSLQLQIKRQGYQGYTVESKQSSSPGSVLFGFLCAESRLISIKVCAQVNAYAQFCINREVKGKVLHVTVHKKHLVKVIK